MSIFTCWDFLSSGHLFEAYLSLFSRGFPKLLPTESNEISRLKLISDFHFWIDWTNCFLTYKNDLIANLLKCEWLLWCIEVINKNLNARLWPTLSKSDVLRSVILNNNFKKVFQYARRQQLLISYCLQEADRASSEISWQYLIYESPLWIIRLIRIHSTLLKHMEGQRYLCFLPRIALKDILNYFREVGGVTIQDETLSMDAWNYEGKIFGYNWKIKDYQTHV